MISDHLNDETACELIESICDAKLIKGIAKIIETYKANVTKKKKENKYPINKSNFYGLPKTHKARLIQNAIKEQ